MEFEVGKALYGLMNAGFIHRIGKTAAPAVAVANEGRVEEHRNLGIAFYKTAMLDEAIREFRRVLELRSDDALARFYVGLVLARQRKWEDALAAFAEAAAQPGGERRRVSQPRRTCSSSSTATTKRAWRSTKRVRRGGADDPRVQTSLGVLSLLAGDLVAADAALTAARPLFGKRPPTPAWFHYMGLTAALRGDGARSAAILNEGVAAHPHSAVLLNNLAAVLERDADYDGARSIAERGVQEDAAVSRSCTRISATCTTARRATTTRSRRTCARPRSIPSWARDMYLKLGNIKLRRQEREEAVRCWERALELDPDNAIVRTNLESVRQVF